LEKADIMDYKKFPLAMKLCISHYKLDLKQAAAFNVICSTFMLAHLEDPSLKKTLNISQTSIIGKGRSGKTSNEFGWILWQWKDFVLDATKSFCKQFCKATGKPFNDSVFVVIATTNTAAAQLKGDTIHSIAGLQRKQPSILKNWSLNWAWAKILFIDEISMMDIMDFLKLDKDIRQLMAQFNPQALNYLFGGLNIVFCGDFAQLNPVGKKDVIYDQSRNALWGMINRVVYLTMTNWRFLKKIHNGEIYFKECIMENQEGKT
jgi:hypothetical protein